MNGFLKKSRIAVLGALSLAGAFPGAAARAGGDWLVDPSPYKAQILIDEAKKELSLENGLVRRTIRLSPNAATVDFTNLVTSEQLLRAVGPEARVTLDGVEYPIGGLTGQPIQNYLNAAWIDSLTPIPGAYRFADWKEEPMTARFPWKKRPEWLSRDLPWPAPGKHVAMRYVPPMVRAKMAGQVLFEDNFGVKMDDAWKVRVSGTHPRSSFANEGKYGEIYTLPNTAVYAERPVPAGTASVEVTVNVGDDTQSNAWGPGLALGAPGQLLAFIVRPNAKVFEVNGAMTEETFDPAKAVMLRVRLENGTAFCEASQDGKKYKQIAVVPCAKAPATLRVGKVGQRGSGADYGAQGSLVRCFVSQVTLRGPEPVMADGQTVSGLPEITVHYAIYDGIPLIEKWLTLRNGSDKPVRVNQMLSETLKVNETEAIADPNINMELSTLYVESDYAYLAMNAKSANKQAVRWLKDPKYHTQTSYFADAICEVEVGPEFGPDVDLAPGETLASVRAFELSRDSTDRERRGLAQRRMYKILAPWTQENPVMAHLISSDPQAIRNLVDQCVGTGFEMIILSFGSGMNLESRDPAYQARYKEVAEYAKSKGLAIGAYNLLASRGAGTGADNCQGPGNRVRYGVMPCLGSQWGRDYLAQMKKFMTNTGFDVFEHDGSYPGDTCAATSHPGHHGLKDSQWVQFRAIADLYQWCRGKGVYLNVPDWYMMNGSSKCSMGYKEPTWSMPRAEQEIMERQNIFDSTWEKTSTMGWMFVPLTSYAGGGAAATIEPLKDHLPHYEARLANLFGSGTQACYRGPRIYDTDETKALVKKWVSFYKAHREVLDADMIHLRRPDGRDWDGFVHVNPSGREKALAFFYNPLGQEIERTIRVPLYYAGLVDRAKVSVAGGPAQAVELDRTQTAILKVTIPANSHTWLLFTE